MLRNLRNRFTFLYAAMLLVCVLVISRLFQLQVVQGEYYRSRSENRLVRSMPIPAPRGEILDRYGRPLITNRQGFALVLRNEYIRKGELNDLIIRTIRSALAHEEDYIDTFPMTMTAPFAFTFPDNGSGGIGEQADAFKKNNKIDPAAGETDVLLHFKAKYEIPDGYAEEELRRIIGVRYEMYRRLFGPNMPYTFATDVGIDFVTYIKEQGEAFAGVTVSVQPIREYVHGTLAAHVLGRVGVIYQEEYEQLRDKGYSNNDIVGKDGIEKVLEEYLRGTDGVSSAEQNIDGKITKVLESKEPKPGNYAVLTLDARLQETLERSMEKTITALRGRAKTSGVTGGAGVVIDVNTGGILAMASNPTFDPAKFNELWSSLSQDPKRPMWNRAISGQYAPGSTFKVLSAIAALESGVVGINETLYCDGVYKYYASSNYTPVCWLYSQSGRGHGPQNVIQAVENSCNLYFYEVGRRMGIDTLASFGAKFGLGEYTGIEIPGEAKGMFASRENRKKNGQVWQPGDTVQAAIGQSDHIFTPIQIANYIATVANGGKRYKTHLVDSVHSYESAETVLKTQPQVLDTIEISAANYNAVLNGMKRVSETGTASGTFLNFDTSLGGKTGSATVAPGKANGLFVAFAPFEDPQIAVALVVELADSGANIAPIARDVIAEYMAVDPIEDQLQPYNELVR